MTTRLLFPGEWSKLAGTELAPLMGRVLPHARVLVVEDECGQIVGGWALMQLLHVEGLWIHPSHRKASSVARRLWAGMRRLVREQGATTVLTAAVTPEIEALLETAHAQRIPGSHWVLPMETPRCH